MTSVEEIKSELVAIQDFLKDKKLCIVITKDSIEILSQGNEVELVTSKSESCSCDNGIIVCPGCDGDKQSEFGICAGCTGKGKVTCGKCGGKTKTK